MINVSIHRVLYANGVPNRQDRRIELPIITGLAEFTNLPVTKNKNGKTITYTVAEKSVPDGLYND